MSDGTPNGYAVLQVAPGGDYTLAYHAARAPDDAQLLLSAPKVLRQGAYAAWGVYANVFIGDAQTPVEMRIDGGAWQPMKRVERPDPRVLAENTRDDAAEQLRGTTAHRRPRPPRIYGGAHCRPRWRSARIPSMCVPPCLPACKARAPPIAWSAPRPEFGAQGAPHNANASTREASWIRAGRRWARWRGSVLAGVSLAGPASLKMRGRR